MILTVDIGNTNIKVGAWDENKLVFVSRLQTNKLKTQDEYAANLLDMFRLNECNSAQFDGAIVASVVPPLSQVLLQAIRTVIGSKRVYLVSPGLKTGLNIKIDNPASLGADMVCCAVAAIAKISLPCIIISLGTATAMFVVDQDANFLGATVTPGVGISLDALSQRTAQLPHISLDKPAALIGKNTVDAMTSGAVYGTASMLDGMIGRMREALGVPEVSVVACGGLAQYIVSYCREEIVVDDNLGLEGMKIIYDKNVK